MRDGESLRKDGNAGDYGTVALDGLIVEREVVEKAPGDDAVDKRADLVDGCSTVAENA